MKKELNIAQLKQWIAENKTEQVFDELKASATFIAKEAFQNQITLLNARWEKLKADQIAGLLADENYRIQLNNINNSLLKALDNLKSGEAVDSNTITETTKPKNRPKWQKIAAALAATIAVLAGLAEISGYSLRDCFTAKKEQTMPIVTPEDLKSGIRQKHHTSTGDTIVLNDSPKKEEAETKASNPKKTIPKKEEVETKASNPKKTKPKKEQPPTKVEATKTITTSKLQIDIKTQKGKENLVFDETEEVQVFFKVNKACKLRSIYRLADGNLILLDNDRQVNTTETNKWVQLSDDGFEVAPPFGKEELYIFAAETNFPALQTQQQDGYTLIVEGLPNALRKTRGLKKKQPFFAESKLNINTQQNKLP